MNNVHKCYRRRKKLHISGHGEKDLYRSNLLGMNFTIAYINMNVYAITKNGVLKAAILKKNEFSAVFDQNGSRKY